MDLGVHVESGLGGYAGVVMLGGLESRFDFEDFLDLVEFFALSEEVASLVCSERTSSSGGIAGVVASCFGFSELDSFCSSVGSDFSVVSVCSGDEERGDGELMGVGEDRATEEGGDKITLEVGDGVMGVCSSAVFGVLFALLLQFSLLSLVLLTLLGAVSLLLLDVLSTIRARAKDISEVVGDVEVEFIGDDAEGKVETKSLVLFGEVVADSEL